MALSLIFEEPENSLAEKPESKLAKLTLLAIRYLIARKSVGEIGI